MVTFYSSFVFHTLNYCWQWKQTVRFLLQMTTVKPKTDMFVWHSYDNITYILGWYVKICFKKVIMKVQSSLKSDRVYRAYLFSLTQFQLVTSPILVYFSRFSCHLYIIKLLRSGFKVEKPLQRCSLLFYHVMKTYCLTTLHS